MKNLRLFVILLIGSMFAMNITAQEIPEGFVEFEESLFNVEGILPEGWVSATTGVYQRGESASDTVAIIVQSAPLPVADLSSTLAMQLGVETFPEPEGEVETDFTTWTVYRINNEEFGLSITVALTEEDGTSYLVILQTPTPEHDELVESVFNPVVNSLRALEVDETQDDEEDMTEDLPFSEEDVTFANGESTLAGTLSIPNEGDDFPVVIIVSGSGGQDRTGSLAPVATLELYTEIADYLARNGIAVLRYDDRGVGESTSDTMNPSLLDFRDDANAAVNFLADRDEFTHIGIAGHSEGGVYAPEIALTNDNVNFVIGLNAPTVSLIEVAIYQQVVLGRQAGIPEETLQAIEDAYRNVVALLNSENVAEDDFRTAVADLVTAQAGSEQTDAVVDGAVAQFQSAIIQDYVSYNPIHLWLDLDVPTLAIFGSLDLQVPIEQNVYIIDGQNNNIDVVVIEGMNHIFQEAETGSIAEYSTLEQTIMPELLETLAEWILETTSE